MKTASDRSGSRGLLVAVLSMLVVVAAPGWSSEGAARDRPDFCDPVFELRYDVDEATLGFKLDERCTEQPGLGRIMARVSLERCDLECSRLVDKRIACPLQGSCRYLFKYPHEPVERARYTARMSYRSKGGPAVVAGMSTRNATCYSVVEAAFCE